MRAIFLGTGFAIPERDRAQSGVLLEMGEHPLLFDCGTGVLSRIGESGRDVMDIEDVFLTHHHLDHDSDFLSIYKAQALAGKRNLNLYAPRGTDKWLASLFQAYPYLEGRMELTNRRMDNGTRIRLTDCSIESVKTSHTRDSLAYKISTPKKSVVYSGDTAPCDGIVKLCKNGVDLLIHECSLPDPEKDEGLPQDHTTPEGLGSLISGLPVKRLAVTHFSPKMRGSKTQLVETISRYFHGEIILARDLLEIDV